LKLSSRNQRNNLLTSSQQKLRQSWNKYNLYNIYQYKSRIDYVHRTFFQQKWAAKSATRAYHGEHVGEKRWTRDFSRRLRSVVDMPVPYLARFDGSEQAEGRGSGKQGLTVTSHSYAPRPKGNKAEDAEGESGPWNALHPPSRSVKTWVFRKFYDKMTPYMQMTYAPMERRLEVAMHRALFASSPRQARQFCIHGAVKVNGKKVSVSSIPEQSWV
jgi:ribosomal protein S4